MCLVNRVQEVRCCFYIGHDGERIVNISSIERTEFTLSLKVFFVGHEHISFAPSYVNSSHQNHFKRCNLHDLFIFSLIMEL